MSLLILWIGIGATVLFGAILKLRATERKLEGLLADVVSVPDPITPIGRPLLTLHSATPAADFGRHYPADLAQAA